MQFIMPLHKGWQIDVMSLDTFLKRPLLWLELMSIHGTQYTFAPDCAYTLVRYEPWYIYISLVLFLFG